MNHLPKHLTQMQEVETDFASSTKKNAKMIEKLYQTHRNVSLGEAVNDWLYRLVLIVSTSRQ